MLVSSEFPEDPEQGRWLLQEFMFTDVVVVGSSDVTDTAKDLGLKLHHVAASNDTWLKRELPDACRTIAKALDGDGCVLVFSESETKASLVVCGYRESTYLSSSRTLIDSSCSHGFEAYISSSRS